jgi:tetraacyldisaccharide 4'-kinase
VALDEPAWWYPEGAGRPLASRLLAPLATLYGSIVSRRLRSTSAQVSPLPVICVGNFTVGGSGKTPLVREIVRRVHAAGRNPVVLTRGYGGRIAGPHAVRRGIDRGADVGDEPLLLAADAPVVVSRDRVAGASFIHAEHGAEAVVVMDDGMQNPALAKTLTLAVVDSRRKLGNGAVFPAGPLRAPFDVQKRWADAVVVVTNGQSEPDTRWLDRFRKDFAKPVLQARVSPVGDLAWLRGRAVMACAGIANPRRFFALLEMLGADVVATDAWGDHRLPTEASARALLAEAAVRGALLVTTEKDLARLAGATGVLAELSAKARALPIAITFEDPDNTTFDGLIGRALADPLPRMP